MSSDRSEVPSIGGPMNELRNERGAVLALVALLLIVFLGMAALAVDLGLLYVARGEAQRAADAAAHAGAGYFLLASEDEEGARDAAVATAARNEVRGQSVEIDREADIDVEMGGVRLVRVRVRRSDEWGGPIRMMFAGILGQGFVNVNAEAAAEVWTAGMAQCPMPIALPDRFCKDWDGSNCSEFSQFGDGPDDVEHYEPWITNPAADPEDWVYNQSYTGYSDADRGTQVTLVAGGGGPGQGGPPGGGGGFGITSWWSFFAYADSSPDVPGIREKLNCDDDRLLTIGDELQVNPGAMASVLSDFRAIVDLDPTATWNASANNGDGCVTSQGSSECRGSPRIRPIVLFNPETGPDGPAGSSEPFQVASMVGMFLEDVGSPPNFGITGRFVEYSATGAAARGPGSGSLSKMIRIVE